MKRLLVIDGQGGGIGRAVIEKIRREQISGLEIIAIGTNAMATAQMLKAGADAGASGESAIIWNCRQADLVIGAIGIVSAGSMLGELSPAMAEAIGTCQAVKILIPLNKCHLQVAGVADEPLPVRIDQAVEMIRQYLDAQEQPCPR